MIMTLLSAVSGKWKWIGIGAGVLLLMAVLCGLAAWRGYRSGFDRADADRRAEIAELHAEHAEALASAERIARERLEAETTRATTLERQYLAAVKTIAAQRRTISNERIRHANRDLDPDDLCRLGPDWVRLYNEAAGAGDRGHALGGTAPGTADAAGTGQAVDARILPGGDTVTPADVLAHMRDYGARCRALEAQLNALIAWIEGGNPHAEAAP